MRPEEKARLAIDEMFDEAGWKIVDRSCYNPTIQAVAIEEGLLKGNLEADYLLFLNGKAVGVLEAKREGKVLSAIVASQAENYTHQLPRWCPCWIDPLPLVYLSNGKDLFFRNMREVDSEYQSLTQMHSPKQITKLLGLMGEFSGLPTLSAKGLRACQYNAVNNLENSFREGQRRALMVLATGAGKTFTACMTSYRALAYTPARKILFLVDRNNLGVQAEGAFGTFRLTNTGDSFTSIYVTIRLNNRTIDKINSANVIISTIQRLFSALTGSDIGDDVEDEDENDIEANNDPEIILKGNLKLPPDYFDLIIIDECHRSIYGENWGKVLGYFTKARLVGLTATPTPETKAFFNDNMVTNYTLERSIVDGVNIACNIYRIQTEATEEGGTIHQGERLKELTKYTGETAFTVQEDRVTYEAGQLDRLVINSAQIRMVIDTYKKAIYAKLYTDRDPNFAYIPKTLIFAKSDKHAQNIVNIIREVFDGQNPDFVQRITCNAGNSENLIKSFRNDKEFRIAVTVTLVATGTDVAPLEIVMFMRDVNSAILYEQMKGRGCRTIGDDKLRTVTPNAVSKDFYYLIDAVGVTAHDKVISEPTGGLMPSKFISLEELLEKTTHGYLPDDYLNSLASRLSRIN